MMTIADLWPVSWTLNRLGKTLFSPEPEGLNAKIEQVKPHLPVPVFWLIGKTQLGKTSII
jgi:hypothetical protein